jgi:hypothetical protein
MPVSIIGNSGIQFPDSSLQAAAASPYVLKNRLINSDMRIDQRNAGASLTQSTSHQFAVDRTFGIGGVAGKFTMQQSSTAPTGFTKSLLVTSTSSYSVPSGDLYLIGQSIEGFNIADLDWGTANAKTVTLSFWVRSSLTGTFGGAIGNAGWLSNTRSYPFSYTISSANTWEQKSITIAGDTTGTWATNNTTGLTVSFGLGVGTSSSATAGAWVGTNVLAPTGATSVVGTNGATFYITGVQLEQNTSATPFERRLYNQELANCQRYFVGIKNDGVNNLLVAPTGVATDSSSAGCMLPLLVEMRTQPSISGTSLAVADSVNPVTNVTSISLRTDISTTKGIYFSASVASGLTTHRPYYVRFQNASSGSFNISAEL